MMLLIICVYVFLYLVCYFYLIIRLLICFYLFIYKCAWECECIIDIICQQCKQRKKKKETEEKDKKDKEKQDTTQLPAVPPVSVRARVPDHTCPVEATRAGTAASCRHEKGLYRRWLMLTPNAICCDVISGNYHLEARHYAQSALLLRWEYGLRADIRAIFVRLSA